MTMNHGMKNIVPLTLPVLLAAASWCTLAQADKPEDVKGWNKVTWGMSVADAKATLGDQATVSTVVPGPNFTDIERLTISNLPVGEDLVGRCGIQTKRNSDAVTSIQIRFGQVRDDPSTRERAFDILKRLLIEKYGSPKNEDRKAEPEDIKSTVLWTFPSTSITLLRSESTRYGLGYLTVTYRAAEKNIL